MKKTLLIFTLVLFFALQETQAQTNHMVTTMGTVFSPDDITIDLGDTVTWTNGGGSHNVNGTTATFPSNPESFTSGAVATGWTFQHVFSIAGVYQYQCDPHAGLGMTGRVTVSGATKIEKAVASSFVVFPNPSTNFVSVLGTSDKARTIQVYGMNGKLVATTQTTSSLTSLSIADLAVGIYQLKVVEQGVVVHQEKISKI